jgi:hypothetical protein
VVKEKTRTAEEQAQQPEPVAPELSSPAYTNVHPMTQYNTDPSPSPPIYRSDGDMLHPPQPPESNAYAALLLSATQNMHERRIAFLEAEFTKWTRTADRSILRGKNIRD